jgi:hypothetical protein
MNECKDWMSIGHEYFAGLRGDQFARLLAKCGRRSRRVKFCMGRSETGLRCQVG